MDWKLEAVVLPVRDVDVMKEFYADRLGFPVDHDTVIAEGRRVVQVTPPGSGCSIAFGTGIADGEPGAVKGLQLVVEDVAAARAELLDQGFDPGPVMHMGPNGPEEGPGGRWNSFLFFADPDGNGWAVQERG